MKHHLLIPALLIILLTSCNNQPKNVAETTTSADPTVTTENNQQGLVTTCYMGLIGKDTMLLQVRRFDNVATGDLSYLFHEKDRQTGEFDARIMGDTLIGEYIFDSEGTSSSRQIAFLLKGDTAVEGYGEVEEKDGGMVFTDLKKLEFGKGLNLNKVACPN